jgi:hypothetical protein
MRRPLSGTLAARDSSEGAWSTTITSSGGVVLRASPARQRPSAAGRPHVVTATVTSARVRWWPSSLALPSRSSNDASRRSSPFGRVTLAYRVQSPRSLRPRGRAAPLRYLDALVLAVVSAGLLAYVVLHTPARNHVGDWLGVGSQGCYICISSAEGARLADALAAAVLIGAAALAAGAITEGGNGPSFERPLTFGIAVLALLTAPAAVVGGVASLTDSTLARPPFGLLLAAVPSVVIAVASAWRGWRPQAPRLAIPSVTPLVAVVLGSAVMVGAAAIVVSFLHPATQGDALTYHAPLGVLFWREGSLTAAIDLAPTDFVFAHPATAEIWYGVLRLLGGERLADLGQVPFGFLGAAAVFAFTRRTGLRDGAAFLAATGFFLVPIVALQLGTQANDVAGSALAMCAIALASAPPSDWSHRRIVFLGLVLGLAATTKLALLPTVVVVGAFVLGTILWKSPAHARGGRLVALSLPFVAIVGPWWLRNVALYGNPLYPQHLPLYGHGVNIRDLGAVDTTFVPARAAWPAYPIVEPIDDRSGFGTLFAVAVAPGFAMAVRRARRLPLGLWAGGLLVTLPAWWNYTLHEPRFLLAYVGLGFAFVPWALVALKGRWRCAAGALIAIAALFSALLTIEQGVVPLARQPVARALFYDRVWGVDPTVLSLPEDDGVLLVTGFGLPRIDYTSAYPLLGPLQRRLVVPLDSSEIGGLRSAIVERMQTAGVEYAYVTAIPRYRREVSRLFAGSDFELVHESAIVEGAPLGARRTVFRRAAHEDSDVIRRLLYRLRAVEGR